MGSHHPVVDSFSITACSFVFYFLLNLSQHSHTIYIVIIYKSMSTIFPDCCYCAVSLVHLSCVVIDLRSMHRDFQLTVDI